MTPPDTAPDDPPARARATWILLDATGTPFTSAVPGTVGGHRRSRIYGRLDCPAALRALARGHYAAHRVFFPDGTTARQAGYRPCAVCLPQPYQHWKTSRREAPLMTDRGQTAPPACDDDARPGAHLPGAIPWDPPAADGTRTATLHAHRQPGVRFSYAVPRW